MASISKRGKRWRALVRKSGSPPLSRTFSTKAEAQRWARDQEQTIETHGAPPDLRLLRSTRLDDLLDRYGKEVSPTKRSGKGEASTIRILRRHPIAQASLANLRPYHIANYRDDRLKEVGPASVRNELALLNHCLNTARTLWEYPLDRALTSVKKPSPPPHRIRRLSQRERALLLSEAEKRIWYLAPIIEFALETGMRRGELIKLLWKDVNTEQRWAILRLTKNGDHRQVPLSPRALEILKSVKKLKKDTKRVFPVSLSGLDLSWKRLKKKTGIEDLRFHDLRHEALSRFFEMGLSVPEVQAISGHKDVATLLKYTHPKAEDIARKLARI